MRSYDVPVTDAAERINAGASALAAGDWLAAREAFAAALEVEESPEALNGLSDALWWLGETGASVELRERAYAGFRRRPDPVAATNIALTLAIHYTANVGNPAASAGWFARARRLVDENDLTELRGWITLSDASEAPDPVTGEGFAREALEQARATGDLDLELCALAQIGSLLVAQGRITEGVALLDEAMAGSLGGEGSTFDTVVFTSCNMIGSCTRSADFERAIQWIRAADRFTERYGCPFLYLYCRTHYGAILVATGDWEEAESQLGVAIRESAEAQVPMHMFSRATLAALRLAQGRLEEAEALIDGFDGQGPAAPVAAGIHLARGGFERAATIATRALDGADQLGGAELSELLGEAEIALGHGDAAAKRGRAVADAGRATGCSLAIARGDRLLGRATEDARSLLAAMDAFSRIGMPLEAARTRLALASARMKQDPSEAEADARAALAAFEKLGAGRDADAAAALLRAMGVKAARSGPKGVGTLTQRESEVLGLLGQGLSNLEIAERLFLSRKTVEHHVASVLAKLGVRNRAEAAARAASSASG